MANSNGITTQSLQESPGFTAPGRVGSSKSGGQLPPGSCSYPWGQCTYYVATQYPVLSQTSCLGNACNWLSSAKKNGWATAGAAYAGAIVVYNCNLPGSGGDGHVAVVQSVNKDGTFTVKEMNWKGLGVVDTREVKTTQYIAGYFSPPGGPEPGALAGPATTAPGPAMGARGLRCQYPLTTPAIPIGGTPYTIGPWSFCLDGLVGVGAFALGLGVMVFAVVLAVRRPAERVAGRAMEVGGAVTGQPEVASAAAAERERLRTPSEQGPRTTPTTASLGIHDGHESARPTRQRREPTSSHLSVQQQQTRRELMGLGYSSVQATEAARAAGSAGTSDERLMAGLRSLGR